MSEFKGALTVFGERQALVLPAHSLDLLENEIVGNNEMYLATDVFQGESGVASFAVNIPRPKSRPFYYMSQEGPAGIYDEEDALMRSDGDPVKRLHWVDTDKGFSAVRVVAAPKYVAEKLKSDKFLGPALIEKCSIEIPGVADLDEETGLYVTDAIGYDQDKISRSLQVKVLRELSTQTGVDYEILRNFPSWHGYRVYAAVMSQIAGICQSTVANFDEVIKLLTKDIPRLHNFDHFQQVGRAIGSLALPPAQEQ